MNSLQFERCAWRSTLGQGPRVRLLASEDLPSLYCVEQAARKVGKQWESFLGCKHTEPEKNSVWYSKGFQEVCYFTGKHQFATK